MWWIARFQEYWNSMWVHSIWELCWTTNNSKLRFSSSGLATWKVVWSHAWKDPLKSLKVLVESGRKIPADVCHSLGQYDELFPLLQSLFHLQATIYTQNKEIFYSILNIFNGRYVVLETLVWFIDSFIQVLYIVRNLRTRLTHLITYWVNIRGILNPTLINRVNKLMTNNIRSIYNWFTFMESSGQFDQTIYSLCQENPSVNFKARLKHL